MPVFILWDGSDNSGSKLADGKGIDELERRRFPGRGVIAAAVQVERLAAVADQALGLVALAAQVLGARAHGLELGVEPADHVEQGFAELAAEGAGHEAASSDDGQRAGRR